MTKLTLLVKASNFGQVKQVEDMLREQFEDLDAELKVASNPTTRWIEVSLSGEDEAIAKSYINKEIGTCPPNLETAKNTRTLNGYLAKIDTAAQQILVDVGVFEPKPTLASVSLERLQAQLVEGKDVSLKKLVDTFGLAVRIPISISPLPGVELASELSDAQVLRLMDWRLSLLDRLIILGASKEEVEGALERARLTRDVIGVEKLGMFEFALTCKLGTVAAGLVSVLGRYMRRSLFVVFDAKRQVG
jgi:hypothetical protein